MKAYAVSVRFDMPQAGIVTVPASSKEDAEQQIRDLLVNNRNVEIVETVEVPVSHLTRHISPLLLELPLFSQ